MSDQNLQEEAARRPSPPPTIGRIVWYRTDGRNGLGYDLPAIVTCTPDTHPGDYPNGRKNPLPVPGSPSTVHLTVFTPGGFGTTAENPKTGRQVERPQDEQFVGAPSIVPGSGTYVEWNVPYDPHAMPRSWRWPERTS